MANNDQAMRTSAVELGIDTASGPALDHIAEMHGLHRGRVGADPDGILRRTEGDAHLRGRIAAYRRNGMSAATLQVKDAITYESPPAKSWATNKSQTQMAIDPGTQSTTAITVSEVRANGSINIVQTFETDDPDRMFRTIKKGVDDAMAGRMFRAADTSHGRARRPPDLCRCGGRTWLVDASMETYGAVLPTECWTLAGEDGHIKVVGDRRVGGYCGKAGGVWSDIPPGPPFDFTPAGFAAMAARWENADHQRIPRPKEVWMEYGRKSRDRAARVIAVKVNETKDPMVEYEVIDTGTMAVVAACLLRPLSDFRMYYFPPPLRFTGARVKVSINGVPVGRIDRMSFDLLKEVPGTIEWKNYGADEFLAARTLNTDPMDLRQPNSVTYQLGPADVSGVRAVVLRHRPAYGSPLRRWLREERLADRFAYLDPNPGKIAALDEMRRTATLVGRLANGIEPYWADPTCWPRPPHVDRPAFRPIAAGDYLACPACGRLRPGGVECDTHAQVRALLDEVDVTGRPA